MNEELNPITRNHMDISPENINIIDLVQMGIAYIEDFIWY